MKKVIFATLLLGASIGSAQAASSVTLYGIIDDGLNYISNAGGGRQIALSNSAGFILGSRWGLKGVEDLGGGYSAIFQLESGFNTSTGALTQSGSFFGRMAYVGVASSKFGNVKLGRQTVSLLDYVGILVPSETWAGTFGAHAGDVDNLDSSFRLNNSVKWTSVNYNGLTFGGMYGFGGQPGNFNRNSGFGFGALYSGGAFNIGAAYQDWQDPYISQFNNGANPPAAISSPIFSAYSSAGSSRIFATVATYDLGDFTFGLDYSNSRFVDLGANPGNLGAKAGLHGTAAFNNVEPFVTFRLSPLTTLAAAYNYTRRSSVNADGGATYNQIAMGINHLLSKRTMVYATAVYQHASGVNSGGGAAVANLTWASPSSNNHQVGVRLALQTKF
jgi:predicted porin